MRSRLGACSLHCAALLVAFTTPAAEDPPPVDAVYLGGKVFTADPAKPWVEALAVRGDRIAAVGSREQVEKLAAPTTRRIELKGRTVIPGLNDAHHHFEVRARGDVAIPAPPSNGWRALAGAVATAASHAPPGATLLGDIPPQAWFDANATRAALDRLAGNHPVVLGTLCGHGALLNSAALKRFGFGERPPDPVGGWFERSPDGRTNGRLLEAAVLLLNRRQETMVDPQTQLEELREMVSSKLGLGWTSIQTMDPIPLRRMADLAVEGGRPLRMRLIRFPVNTEDIDEIQGNSNLAVHPAPNVTVSGLKWFLDGAPCEETAGIRGTLADGTKPRRLYSLEKVRFMLRQGEEHHQPLLFHASGGAAIDELLAAMESMPEVDWPSRRVRIEHGDELRAEFFVRAKRLGIVLVQNPLHLAPAPGMSPNFLKDAFPGGPAQPLRSVVDAGIPIALGTDAPDNPGLNILLASTNPNNPAEALTREEAVIAFTRGAAYAEFAEKEKGTLAPGMLADFVVLSKDVFTAPAEEMPTIRAVLTVIGGQVAYDGRSSTDAGVR
jgi:predicted amidohydrolase YtcJ